VADDSVLAVLPVAGGVREELVEDFGRLPRLLHLGFGLIPLRLSVLRFQPRSNRQPPLELLDENLPSESMAARCFSAAGSLKSNVAGLAGVSVLDQLVVVALSGDDDVAGCDEEVLAGAPRIEDGAAPGAADPMVGLASVEMGRPTAVEKGSMTRTVGMERR
jgi:hypothetical protein